MAIGQPGRMWCQTTTVAKWANLGDWNLSRSFVIEYLHPRGSTCRVSTREWLVVFIDEIAKWDKILLRGRIGSGILEHFATLVLAALRDALGNSKLLNYR